MGASCRVVLAIAGTCVSVGLASLVAGPAAAARDAGTATAVAASACGAKPGVKATGTPIILASIDTDQVGTSFTDVQNMTAAYFNCVNANGGINGHPIKYYRMVEQTNATQIAAEARLLVTNDHVMGIVGNSSIIECSVDAAYWKAHGFYVLGAGFSPGCWGTPNTASVNMGPRYSSDGATQYVISRGADKIVFAQSNAPGTAYIAGGPNAVAKARHVPIEDFDVRVPVLNANSVATSLVDAAGRAGAVVLNFTPPDALEILQAAQQLGLESKVRFWACASICDTDYMATVLGPKWDGKLFINADLTPLDRNSTRTAQLYRAILARYGHDVAGGQGFFSQLGFLDAELAIGALKTIKGPYSVHSVNAAFLAIKNFSTGMLCQAFTYGNYPVHIPDNMDYTVTPEAGQLVQAQGCTDIPNADPQIAAYRKIAGTAQ